jgi:NDP-mannose synthase
MVMYIEEHRHPVAPHRRRDRREAFILAGGKGIRLRPYTTLIPKPLVPIGDQSVLEIVLCQLAAAGFSKATIAIGHLGQLIRAYIGDGSQWGIEVAYVTEDRPLGTVGPLLNALDDLPADVIVMNGDILTDIRYDLLLRTHVDSGATLTMATFSRDHRVDFGVLDVRNGEVVDFIEKPTYTYAVSMGVYAVHTDMLRQYPPGTDLGFDTLVLDRLRHGDRPVSYPFAGFWLDIGRPDDFDQANADIEMLRPRLLPERRAS